MAIKAAAYLQSAGPEKAFAAFDAKTGVWHDRDLYVFVLNHDGVMAADGANAGLIGKNVLNLMDVDGKPFSREMAAVTDTRWVDYKWQNPVTKAVEPKTPCNICVGDYVVVIVGAYA